MARTKQEAREILGGKTVARNSTISANQTVSELRHEFIEAFKVKYKEELDQLPEGTLFLDAVWYLSGVDLKGDLGKPPKKVISSKLRDVVMDLIPRNLVAAIRVFPS